MNYKIIARIVSQILGLEALFMLPSLFLALAEGRSRTALAFFASAGIVALVSLALFLLSRRGGKERQYFAREGMVSVALSWILMGLFGALPFFFSGEIPRYIDALFEIVSGFTTTGASVVPDVETLSRAVLYWRSFSHWLGGMGVLVFLLAIVPTANRGTGNTVHLLRAESPGPTVGKLAPRMRETAKILYLIYIALTALCFLFLLFGGMPVFDALCTAFGTAGTGGFAVKNDSLAGYSPYLQTVTAVFMLLFGVNFTVYHLIFLKQLRPAFKNDELRLYLGLVAGSTALVAFNIRALYATAGETLRHAFFQVSSIMTTTGFSTADFDAWPVLSKVILVLLMCVGASAGSTGGGFKVARLILVFKTLRRNIRRTLHPQKVQVIRSGGQVISERSIENTSNYLAAYVFILLVSVLVLSFDASSATTALTSVVACFNNIGPGLDGVGPTCNYGAYSVLSKLTLILDMLAGRLEIFPILVLFSRSTWTK